MKFSSALIMNRCKIKYRLFFILLFEISLTTCSTMDDMLLASANKIGTKLWELGSNLTRHFELKSDYSNANVTELDQAYILDEMINRISVMLERKKSTLHRIVHTMEERSKNLPDYADPKERLTYKFRDVKNLTVEDRNSLSMDVNFFNEYVALNFSTVHVPTDVYSRGNETILGIQCSKELDALFQHNYATDSTLSWQYFAGVTGYMRLYPGIQWMDDEEGQECIFDARSRPWYIEAAADPKDIMILVDNSGSMMGQKKKIARHTVNNILDTLGPNDFVNIFQFEEETLPVTDCFKSRLVQANSVTIRELKFGVENMSKANSKADFPDALTKAFGVLHHHRKENLASMCNQAIMLITDGVPESYTEIFQKYNWKNNTEPPFPVRVFTYLIGRDGADHRETKWMACANQGYYVHLNTIPEVKEQVFNYINVLARPMVLQNSKKMAWTSLYAHKMDSKITDYRWDKEQNKQQKDYTNSYRDNWRAFLNVTSQKKRAAQWKKVMQDQNKYANQVEGFHFLISISHPAYDQRPKKANVATLLGVAGTDIPISEFKKITKPYYLGVNNYGFIVNNNGYIIMHPDLRPFFRETLKPGYNSVDMLEVELLDTGDQNKEPRDFDIQVHLDKNDEPMFILSNLSLLRDLIINQTDKAVQSYQIKYHYDNIKRVSTGRRNYHMRKIRDSPFTLVLATMQPPCNSSNCQVARLVAPNAERKITLTENNVKELFSTGNWNIHPEWFYCKHNYNNEFRQKYADADIANKTSELWYFMWKMATDKEDTFWKNSRDPYADYIDDRKPYNFEKKPYSSYGAEKNIKKEPNIPVLSYYCDQELIRNVIFDANVTKHMFKHLDNGFSPPPELNFSEDSIQVVFVATHSGLTRWKDITTKDRTNFGFEQGTSIDEVWYKRAVQQYYVNKESFVFSVPLDNEYSEDLLVTASHAIFVKEKRKRSEDALQAPAAVVGFQLRHSDFDRYIRTSIETAYRNSPQASILYYVLDNNGYIISANSTENVGKFFGAVQPDTMRSFKECRIFRKIIIYDYQGVCFYDQIPTNAAYATLTKPLEQVNQWLMWTFGTFLMGVIRINVEILISGLILPFKTEVTVSDEDEYVEYEYETFQEELAEDSLYEPKYSRVKHVVVLNRTRPQTCDRKIELYQLEPEKTWERRMNCTNVTSLLRIIPHTNLLLVVLSNASENVYKKKTLATEPVKVKTKSGYSSAVCYKVNTGLSRRRPKSCLKDHKDEKKIVLCGGGSSVHVSLLTIVTSFLTCFRHVLQTA